MIRWPAVVVLTVLWLLLWGDVTPLLVIGGVLVSLLAVKVFPFPPAMWQGTFRPWSFVLLVARFAYDLVVASMQVSWTAVRPRRPPPSAIIAVQLHTRSELLMSLTAELISLVPGSLLIELDAEDGTLWLHVLDGSQDLARAEAKALAQERRVIAALGSRAERDAYCRTTSTTEASS